MTRPTTATGERQFGIATLPADPSGSRKTGPKPVRAALRILEAMTAAAFGLTLLLNHTDGMPAWLQTCDATVCTLQLAALLFGAARPGGLHAASF